MISFPFCKINLGLHVLYKRQDGYHELETCFYPIPWTDILEIIPHTEFDFTSTGISISGKQEDNLCIKAFHLLQKDFGLSNISIHLHKIIPMGAGLGGGSSDAAFTLRLLSNVFSLNLSIDQLQSYAAQLGSDCSFFIQDKPMIGTGRGEVLTPTSVNLKGFHFVLVKPDIHVSTAEAYAGVVPRQTDKGIIEILKQPVTFWKESLKNDFEASVFQKYPAIQKIKEDLYNHGAIYASMSGSGSSVVGLFANPIDLKDHFRGMAYRTGELN